MRKILKRVIYIVLFVFITIYVSYFMEAALKLLDWYKYKELMGITGVALVLISFVYSIVKRTPGATNKLLYLKLHMILAVAGTIIIFTHASFNHLFIFPVLTYVLLFVVYFSGFIGSFLVREVKIEMEGSRESGVNPHSLIFLNKAVSAWRTVHIPLVTYLAVFLAIHVISTLYYYGIRF